MVEEEIMVSPVKMLVTGILVFTFIAFFFSMVITTVAINKCKGDLGATYKKVTKVLETEGRAGVDEWIANANADFPGRTVGIAKISEIIPEYTDNAAIDYIGAPMQLVLKRDIEINFPIFGNLFNFTITVGGNVTDRTNFSPSTNGAEYKLGTEFMEQNNYVD